MKDDQYFRNAALVVAHPDDEVLWFSSILRKLDDIYLCFFDAGHAPAIGNARRRAIGQHPLKTITGLDLQSPGKPGYANWHKPVRTDYGFRIPWWQPTLRASYSHTAKKLKQRLAQELQGKSNVFTHNPWGEYGCEHHVMVFQTVTALQSKLNYRIWCSSYFARRTLRYMSRYLPRIGPEYFVHATDSEIAEEAMMQYKNNDCWTWNDDWRWPTSEAFFQLQTSQAAQLSAGSRIIPPMNYIG